MSAIKLSTIDKDILNILINRELYGLEILDQINLDRPVPLSFGRLYPALNRLVKHGLVSWRLGDVQKGSGGARRKYYKATNSDIQLENGQYYKSLIPAHTTITISTQQARLLTQRVQAMHRYLERKIYGG